MIVAAHDRPHRVLEDLVKAAIELGAQAFPDIAFSDWGHILTFKDEKGQSVVPTSTLATLDKGGNPHKIPLKEGAVIPDGRPFHLHHKPSDSHSYFLGLEVDRDTEPLSTTKARRNITEKFEHYEEVFKRHLYESHYGFDNSLVLWVAVSEQRMDAMMRLYEQKFGKPCSYHVFMHWKDWFYEVSYPKLADMDLFTREGSRVRKPIYRLSEFWRA